ncbi:13322_t:CDS:2, partial [Entrophospora sp. SA101]
MAPKVDIDIQIDNVIIYKHNLERNSLFIYRNWRDPSEIFLAMIMDNIQELTPTPELVVLDTTTKPFKWITPPVTTPEVPINSLTRHQADLIGDYMV